MDRRIPEIIENMPRSVKGAYVIEFFLQSPIFLTVGKLGKFRLEPGWCYYIGSARNGLRGRLIRHITGKGRLWWHIDYLRRKIAPARFWYVVTDERLESSIVKIVESKAAPAIAGFGAGDSTDDSSHLFFSERRVNYKKQLKKLGPVKMVVIRGKTSGQDVIK